MFDLFRSRAKAVRYLLMVLLTLVALSMVVTLIPGFGSSFGGPSNEQIIAEVGDEVLSTRMVNQAIQAQMKEQGFGREMVEVVGPQLIQRMVGELATAYQAERMGFSVSEEELAQGIRVMIPQLFQGGQFVGTEVYQQFLYQMNMTIPEFENRVRKQLLLNKLQALAFQGTLVTPAEIEKEFQRRNEKVKLAVVKFDPADLRDQVKPTTAELEAYLKANQARFMIPAQRTVDLLIVDERKLGESIPLTEQALRQAYSSQLDRFRVEERVHVRHILLKSDEQTPKEEVPKIRAKAEDLLRKIRGGADFAALAKEHSEDPGSGSKGGDLDWVTRGQTVKPFEDAAFALQPKQISELVLSPFGFHIIQTLEKEGGRLKPFEEVRDELALELKRRQLFDRMPALADQAHAELTKDPGQAAQIAQKLNLLHARAEKVKPGAAYPVLGKNQELDNALVQLDKGGITPVIQTKDNQLVVAVVQDLVPAKPASLSEMESDVRTGYAETKALELAETRAGQFREKLSANGNDLHKTARELGVKLIETNEFERAGQMEGVGPAAYFGEQPFVNPVGQVVGIYRVARTPYFFKILSKSPADPAKLAAERDAIVSGIREQKLRERRELFEEGLIRQLTESGKVKIYDDSVKRLLASYRS